MSISRAADLEGSNNCERVVFKDMYIHLIPRIKNSLAQSLIRKEDGGQSLFWWLNVQRITWQGGREKDVDAANRQCGEMDRCERLESKDSSFPGFRLSSSGNLLSQDLSYPQMRILLSQDLSYPHLWILLSQGLSYSSSGCSATLNSLITACVTKTTGCV